jgi:MFS family permease
MFKDRRLWLIYAILLLDSIGAGCLAPMLSEYIGDMPGKTFWLTGGTALMLAAQLATAPVWGYFSDKAGRRKPLQMAVMGSFLTSLILLPMQGWAFVVNRAVKGCTNGLYSILRSAATDITAKEDLIQVTGFFSFLSAFGGVFGPMIGGILVLSVPAARQSPQPLVWLGIGLVAMGLLLTQFAFNETCEDEPEDVEVQKLKEKSIDALKVTKLWESLNEQDSKVKGLKAVFILNLLGILSFGYYAFFIAFLTQSDLKMKPEDLSRFFIFYGTLALIANLLYFRFLADVVNKRAWLLGLTLLGVVITVGYAFAGSSLPVLYAVAGLDAVSLSLVGGLTGGLLSELVAEGSDQGEAFGGFQALGSIASFATVLVNSLLSLVSLQAPFFFSALGLAALAWFTFRLPDEARQKVEAKSKDKAEEPA